MWQHQGGLRADQDEGHDELPAKCLAGGHRLGRRKEAQRAHIRANLRPRHQRRLHVRHAWTEVTWALKACRGLVICSADAQAGAMLQKPPCSCSSLRLAGQGMLIRLGWLSDAGLSGHEQGK